VRCMLSAREAATGLRTTHTLLATLAFAVGLGPRGVVGQAVHESSVPSRTPAAGAVARAPEGLDALIRDVMTRGGVPGLAVAVLRNGAVAWVGAYGVADADSSRPVTVETVFDAASLGKPVFAYAVLRLAERGEFDLDRPLPEYLPSGELKGNPRAKMITGRRVLSHTSGLPNWRGGGPLTIEFDPGDRFSYSGEGYLYLQQVIETVTSLNADALVRREVFAPLGMAASSYAWRDSYDSTAAVGHDYLQRPVRKDAHAKANVAATLYTTVGDYAHFVAETLRPTLVKDTTEVEMLKAQVEVQKDVAWGLGWGLERSAEGRLFWHWGDNETFQSFAIGCRATGDALVLLTNGENGLSIAEPIVDAVLPGPHAVFGWLDYDRFDSPARTIRERVVRAGGANGERGVVRTLSELERTYPRAAFTEKLLNRIGYELLGKKRVDAAAAVFERNVKLYPASWNVYDSLAEAYAAGGDTQLAIQYYTKSLKLNPDNANAKAALRQLRDAKTR